MLAPVAFQAAVVAPRLETALLLRRRSRETQQQRCQRDRHRAAAQQSARKFRGGRNLVVSSQTRDDLRRHDQHATNTRAAPMDEATPADVVSIVAELARPLAASGFDLVAPLQASWYNEEPHIAELPAAHKLPARRADQLALLVANTRALWKPFCRWAKARGAEYLEAHADDALDTYAAEVVAAALRR